MNLTVAKKIIGGFAIISILLILTSVISLLNLNTISDSTNQQNQLAIPTLKGSNNLSLKLTQMANLTLKGFYQTEVTSLEENLNSYKLVDAKFIPAFKDLKILVQNENNLISNLNKANQVIANFEEEALAVFSNRNILYLEDFYLPLMLSFENTEVAFSGKSNSELKWAHRLFRLIGNNTLTVFGKHATNFALWLRLPITGIIKKTIFVL